MNSETLKVAIDARIAPASAGGVAQVILGLIRALGQLDDPSTRYKIIVESEVEQDFLKAHLGINQQFAVKPRSPKNRVQTLLKRTKASVAHRFFGENSGPASFPPMSDGFIESLGCDVMHFPHQRFQLCGLPTIYNPHDLQHLHLPQFFLPSQIAHREVIYRWGCQLADTVAVSSRWIKEDVLHQYQISERKVQVIPWAPPTEAYVDPSPEEVSAVEKKYKLERPFALYPAVTWPHKNHLRMLEALALLRDTRNLKVRLVCTGSRVEPHWSVVQNRINELNLGSQVFFVGFVSDSDLRAMYKLSQFMIMPSLFESDSSPIYEAWLEGKPIACSNVTSLPVQVMDAGLLFDPYAPEAIAEAMAQLATGEELRRKLAELGRLRVKDYDWERTAKAYRALYRRAAGLQLSDEDNWLLSWDWMEKPVRRSEGSSEVSA